MFCVTKYIISSIVAADGLQGVSDMFHGTITQYLRPPRSHSMSGCSLIACESLTQVTVKLGFGTKWPHTSAQPCNHGADDPSFPFEFSSQCSAVPWMLITFYRCHSPWQCAANCAVRTVCVREIDVLQYFLHSHPNSFFFNCSIVQPKVYKMLT